MMGPHEPVLRVHDGDRIVTTTVDYRGFDHKREKAAPRGSLQNGRFCVVEPDAGDTLVVAWESIILNFGIFS